MTDQSAVYLDSSALVRWVVREPGWSELADYLRDRPIRVASRIADVEVRRAVARVPGLDAERRLTRVLARVTKVELDAELATVAGRLAPAGLRTLDAIHLVSAMAIGGQLEALVTYDRRLADAAATLGISTIAPGA